MLRQFADGGDGKKLTAIGTVEDDLDFRALVPVERIELPTFGLQNRCSTAELNRRIETRLYRRCAAAKESPIAACGVVK
jgi:hypothetical protein